MFVALRGKYLAMAHSILHNREDAEDAVQEAFLSAHRHVRSFEGRSALRSWLYRIATNVCLDSLRGRSRRALPMDLGPAGSPEPANLWLWPQRFSTASAGAREVAIWSRTSAAAERRADGVKGLRSG